MNGQEKLKKWQLIKSLFKPDYLPLLGSLPELQAKPFSLSPQPEELTAFNQLTGWTDTCHLAPTWLQMRSFPTMLNLLSSSDFPFSPLGLVHLENDIAIHDALPVSADYHISCGITGYQSHHKGVIANAYVEARVDTNTDDINAGQLVYRVDARFLAILKAVKQLPKARKPGLHPVIQQIQESSWQLEENIGRRYAKISGDYNLIHIHPLCARLLGFRRHIAHGMYLQARALAEILASGAAANTGFPMHITTAFKKPVYLPANTTLGYSPIENGLKFELYNGARLHLTGRIK